MFRFDLSVLPAHQRYRGIPDDGDAQPFATKKNRRKGKAKNYPYSPARTAKTQSSASNSSITSSDDSGNNHNQDVFTNKDVFTPDFSRFHSNNDKCERPSSPIIGLLRRRQKANPFQNSSSRLDTTGVKRTRESKPSSKFPSLLGKQVLKSLRKNISLANSQSFESSNACGSDVTGFSTMKKPSKKKPKRIPPLEFEVSVAEGGEEVEVTTRRMGRSIEFGSSDEEEEPDSEDSGSSTCPPSPAKIFRTATATHSTANSTFATTSLTSGEESNNAEIYEDDADIRRLCDLMDKIRADIREHEGEIISNCHSRGSSATNSEDSHPASADLALTESKDSSVPSSLSNSSNHRMISLHEVEIGSEEESTEEQAVAEDARETSHSPPKPAGSFDQLMIFVNNEHKVLEYAPDEF